jgi:tRNA(His) 5'-end guanylyltransferase
MENKNDMTLKEKSKFFQERRNYLIDTDKYILVHVDGRSFSKMVKNKFRKPFDDSFIEMMNQTAVYLCENVQGCQLAYVQSDEISLLIKKNNPEGDVFFGGRLCKMQSIIASLASAKFNQLMMIYNITGENGTCDVYTDNTEIVDEIVNVIHDSPLYQFDCKVWDVDSANDAMAWFLFRNIDCIRNSKQQTAQTYLTHKELIGLDTNKQIELLLNKTNIDWNTFDCGKKYGRLVYKKEFDAETTINGETIQYKRNRFEASDGFDLTNPDNRNKLREICPILNTENNE